MSKGLRLVLGMTAKCPQEGTYTQEEPESHDIWEMAEGSWVKRCKRDHIGASTIYEAGQNEAEQMKT